MINTLPTLPIMKSNEFRPLELKFKYTYIYPLLTIFV